MRDYERMMAEQSAESMREYSYDPAFRSQPASQGSDGGTRPKSKPKSSKKKSRGGDSGPGVVSRQRSGDEESVANSRGGQQRSRSAMSASKTKLPGVHKELTIEERLDIQLQQIMKSKSKLAIAMERVSADMHIKKRDREISKMKRDIAESLSTTHSQREEIVRLETDLHEKEAKMEELKKRNFKLLTKQRHFDDMKSKVN